MIVDRPAVPRVLTFGVLLCPGCACERIFRAVAPCKHITDAYCEECGYTYGRLGGAPVIADDVAADAARRYQAATGLRGIMPPPPPVDASEPSRRERSYADDAISRLRP